MARKGRTIPPPPPLPRFINVLPLITQVEWKMLWVVLDTAIENGAYDHDPEIKKDYMELREKVARRGDIR